MKKYWLLAVLCGRARIPRLDQNYRQIARISPVTEELISFASQAGLIARHRIMNYELISLGYQQRIAKSQNKIFEFLKKTIEPPMPYVFVDTSYSDFIPAKVVIGYLISGRNRDQANNSGKLNTYKK